MPKVNGRAMVARPYVPQGVKRTNSWHGVPGARHIPAPDDPAFPHFTFIVSDWAAAGIEMTDELMAAVAKLAQLRLQRQRQRDAADAQERERMAAAAAAPAPAPGAFGDDPNGVVYYIRRRQYVKIGTTTQLQARMRDLMPDEILAIEPGSYKLEGQLHIRFAHLRLSPRHEYFRLADDLKQHIAKVVAEVGAPPTGLTISDFLGSGPDAPEPLAS